MHWWHLNESLFFIFDFMTKILRSHKLLYENFIKAISSFLPCELASAASFAFKQKIIFSNIFITRHIFAKFWLDGKLLVLSSLSRKVASTKSLWPVMHEASDEQTENSYIPSNKHTQIFVHTCIYTHIYIKGEMCKHRWCIYQYTNTQKSVFVKIYILTYS